MHTEYNQGRRKARAKALIDLHAGDEGVRYVDAAEYAGRNAFAVAVVDANGNTRAVASTLSTQPEEAEEIALAIADRDCQTVLSDSRQAVRNFAKGRFAPAAIRILVQEARKDKNVRIKWFPAHAGEASERNENHNETAHAAARALTDRDRSGCRPLWFSTKDRMVNYNE